MPVFFLSPAAGIHPVLVTIATGELEAQYLPADPVIQPSTCMAGSCFGVCSASPRMESATNGRGSGAQCGSEHPLLDRDFGCVCPVCVYACVSLTALERGARELGFCWKSQEWKLKREKSSTSCHREVLLCKDRLQSFSWNG